MGRAAPGIGARTHDYGSGTIPGPAGVRAGPAAAALRGVLVDRYSERHVLLAAQLGLGLVSAALE